MELVTPASLFFTAKQQEEVACKINFGEDGYAVHSTITFL
jgi:hypothetical protein